jgi:hypothetical protein
MRYTTDYLQMGAVVDFEGYPIAKSKSITNSITRV